MNGHARIDAAHEPDWFPIADRETVIDNAAVARNAMKPLHQPLVRWVEHWIISLGMSVIAYLLERVILRSIKNSGAKH